jgi:putative tryptophan/tyrosine transport system substrate-binding protein
MRLCTVGLVVTLALVRLLLSPTSGAQPATKVYRIGWLSAGTRPSGSVTAIGAFQQGLRDLGYVEGQNLVIEQRYAEGDDERLPALAAELVRLRVDVLVTIFTRAALAAKDATTTIPIVMSGVSKPVERGLVASLAHPGGNLTGLANNPGQGFSGKQIELLKEAVPTLSRVGVFWDSTFQDVRDYEAAAQALGITVISADVQKPEHVAAAFATMLQERAEALFVTAAAQNVRHYRQIVEFATVHRLPTMFDDSGVVEAGGLMSYFLNWSDLRRRSAVYVDKILKGAKPADLPVEQPTTFELIINLKTAQALGLTIPPSLLFQANEVIR